MNHERMIMKGQLAEIERRLTALDLESKGDIALIRLRLNPYEPDITKIKTGEALAAMTRLDKAVAEARELKARIAELREAIDG